MKLNILYTVNKKYIPIMLVSLLSLIENNNVPINIHIIGDDLEVSDYKECESLIGIRDDIDIKFYDLRKVNIEKYGLHNYRGTQISNARLFFDEIIKLNNEKQLLYLDSDTIVVNPIGDLSKYKEAVCGVLDSITLSRLKSIGLTSYRNSGVLLFNLDEFRDKDVLIRLKEYVQKYGTAGFDYPDQDLINQVLKDEMGTLPFRYNICPYPKIDKNGFNRKFYGSRTLISYDDIKDEVNKAIILHTYGLFGLKPWVKNDVNPFNTEFDKYMNMINPEFEKMNPDKLRQFLNNHEWLLHFILIYKNYVPAKVDKTYRQYNLKKQK